MKKIKGIKVFKVNIDNKQFPTYRVSISFFAKFFKTYLIWDLYEFGLMLKINKQDNIGKYHFSIDMQILWLNIWTQCWRKNKFN